MHRQQRDSANYGPAVAEISQNLGYSERFLSTSLTKFWVPDNPDFKLADRDDAHLEQLTDDFLRTKGGKLWGARGRIPRYPDDAKTIREGVLQILKRQRRSQYNQRAEKRAWQTQGNDEEHDRETALEAVGMPAIAIEVSDSTSAATPSITTSSYTRSSHSPSPPRRQATPPQVLATGMQPFQVVTEPDRWEDLSPPQHVVKHAFVDTHDPLPVRHNTRVVAKVENDGPPPPYDLFLAVRFDEYNQSTHSISIIDNDLSFSGTDPAGLSEHSVAPVVLPDDQAMNTDRNTEDQAEDEPTTPLTRSFATHQQQPRTAESKNNSISWSWKKAFSSLTVHRGKETPGKRRSIMLRHASSCLSLRDYKQKLSHQ